MGQIRVSRRQAWVDSEGGAHHCLSPAPRPAASAPLQPRTWISVLPPSSRRMARPMLSWKIFSFLVLVMRSQTNLVAPSLSRRHWVAAMADQSWSGPWGDAHMRDSGWRQEPATRGRVKLVHDTDQSLWGQGARPGSWTSGSGGNSATASSAAGCPGRSRRGAW